MIYLTKYISLLVQIILVVAAVVAFCWFDPFDILQMRKLRMQQTAVMVENIRAIGELYSAEYYGEVIKASNQKLTDSIAEELAARRTAILDMEKSIISELKMVYDADKKVSAGDLYKRKMQPFFTRVRNSKKEKIYENTMEALLRTERVRKELPWILPRPRYSVMHLLYEQNRNEKPAPSFISPVALESVVEDEYGLKRKDSKLQERNQLVILARGWVKAGIDFRNFDSNHLKYLKDRNRILLTRHKPRILSKTINPWFIPKESIKGFEYLIIGDNYRKYTDERALLSNVQQLKSDCLNDLEQQALQADLLAIAKRNAEETLSKFFSLLLEKTITVEIFGHPLEAYRAEFSGADNKLTPFEAKSIDSLISIFADTAFYQTTQFAKALKDLDQKNIHTNLKGADWNVISVHHSMSLDSTYSAVEKIRLDALEQEVQPNDYFYFMLFDKQATLDSLLNKEDNFNLDALRNYVNADSTSQSQFKTYRKNKFEKLRKALKEM